MYYKIRNKATGLFSKGGTSARTSSYSWSPTGKVWTNRTLMTHLRQYMTRPRESIVGAFTLPENWEIVEIEFKELNVIPARDYCIDKIVSKRKKRR